MIVTRRQGSRHRPWAKVPAVTTASDTQDEQQPLALRARKQQRARQQAIEAASRIFRERGYDETSLEDIANDAEMSVSSLLRYFGGKERLALAHHINHLESFRQHLAEEDKPVLERWRAFII